MIPQSVYELLPTIYFGSGVVSAGLIDSNLVYFSTFLLIATSIFITLMRISYRKSREASLRGIEYTAKIERRRRQLKKSNQRRLANR